MSIFRLLCVPVGILLATSVVSAQVTLVDWTNDAGGLYSDPANWSGGVVPSGESLGPRFASLGHNTVGLPNASPLEIGAFRSSLSGTSSLKLQPADATGDSTINVSGLLTHAGGTLNIGFYGLGIETHFTAQATLVSGGGDLQIDDGATLSTAGLVVQVGTDTKPSRVWLRSTAESSFGAVSLGESGAGSREAVLQIEAEATARASMITIASLDQSGLTGELTVNGTLLQTGDSDLTIGRDADEVSALTVVSSGGHLTTGGGTVTVHRSGELKNLGGQVTFLGELTVNGGKYLESGAATRSFEPGAEVRVQNGGQAAFVADLLLDQGQTLGVHGPGAIVSVGGDLTLGADSTLAFSFDSLVASEAKIVLQTGEAQLAGQLVLDAPGVSGLGIGSSFPLVAAASFSGSLSLATMPALPSGLNWRLEEQQGVLSAVVTDQTTLAGDYNHDGVVDAADYTVWRDTLGSSSLNDADGNGDGTVDSGDYLVWRQNYGKTQSASVPVTGDLDATVAPEPATFTLFLAVILLVLGSSRKNLEMFSGNP
jgi:hypothetical protein